MKFCGHLPFDVNELRELAGERAFARGRNYADHGHIALLSINDDGVLAAAPGTSDYTVWLKRSGSGILQAYGGARPRRK